MRKQIYVERCDSLNELAAHAAAYRAVHGALLVGEYTGKFVSDVSGLVTAETLLSFQLIKSAEDAVKKHARYIASMWRKPRRVSKSKTKKAAAARKPTDWGAIGAHARATGEEPA